MSVTELPARTGRPRNKSQDNKSVIVGTRVTALEALAIDAKCAAAGNITRSAFLYSAVTSKTVKATSRRSTDPQLITKLDRLITAIDAIGNVVNQVALAGHTGRRMRPEWDMLPDEINRLKAEVSQTLDKVVGE